MLHQKKGWFCTFDLNLTSEQHLSPHSMYNGKLPAYICIRELGDTVLIMSSINIIRMFVENVILTFRRIFWELN